MKKTSTKEWFEKWKDIIREKEEISRVDLADLSNCSIWTIRSLSSDFIKSEAHITYRKGVYRWYKPQLISTLSTLSEEEKHDLV